MVDRQEVRARRGQPRLSAGQLGAATGLTGVPAPKASWQYRMFQRLAWRAGPFVRWRWEYARGLTPARLGTPLIVASNHQSYADPLLVSAGIPFRIDYLARRSSVEKPALGRLLRSCHCISVDTSNPTRAITAAVRQLRNGGVVGIFPEGARMAPAVDDHDYSLGVALLSHMTRAPVLPVHVIGSGMLYGRDHRVPRLGRAVTVRYGRLVEPCETKPGVDRKCAYRDYAMRIRREITDL